MTTIECVARAIAAELDDDFDAAFESKQAWTRARGGNPFRDISMPFKPDYLAAARAAIEAMMEPSEAMIDAARDTPAMRAINDVMLLHQARGYTFPDDAFDDGAPLAQAWRAMIRAALEEKP